jgi:hypothetical protein
MQCSELEIYFEQQGLSPLSAAAREHLAQCAPCKDYVADLAAIVAAAHQFPAEIDPPERVWISIRAELESEGVIHGFSKQREAAPWWHRFADLFRNRLLATAAVGVLIVIAAVQLEKPRNVVVELHDDPFGSTGSALSQQEHDLANMQLASTGAPLSPVDTSLRQNLQQVNEFIADCEQRVKEQPSDELAREYLTNAYQQKAQLISAMMDRGGSLN